MIDRILGEHMETTSSRKWRGTRALSMLAGILTMGLTVTEVLADDTFTCKSVRAKQDSCTPLKLLPTLWPDVCNPQLNGWNPVQGSFDQLSWQSFSVLSWPVVPNKRGVPDKTKSPGDKDASGKFLPMVWESYKGLEEVFTGSKIPPGAWNSEEPVPSICPSGTGLRAVSMTSKTRSPHAVGGHAAPGPLRSVNQAVGGPLVDQNGNLVVYEIRINEVMFNDIVDKKAWNMSHDQLTCSGKYATKGCTPFEFSKGAIEAKAAWKMLTDAEKKSGKFFVRDLLVYIPADDNKGATSCQTQTMGLVGLHISRKTPFSTVASQSNSGSNKKPDWAWATFENDFNAPPLGDSRTIGAYSFNNPACTPSVTPDQCRKAVMTNSHGNVVPNPDTKYACCQNMLRYGPVGPQGDPWVMKRGPIQLTRVDKSPQETEQCNGVWDRTLAKTIWDRYFLVTTQWPKKQDAPPFDAMPTPSHNRNTVIETYMTEWQQQANDTVQTNTSSCMGCHQFGIDMSFVFSAAK